MSNIVKDNFEFLVLNDFLKRELSIEEVLNELIPAEDDKLLVKYSLKNKGSFVARFMPEYNTIEIAQKDLDKYLDETANDIAEEYNFNDTKILRDYFYVFLLTHEIEHSYQYLMGKGIIEAPNTVLKDAYKGLYDMFIPNKSFLPRPISKAIRLYRLSLYKKNQNEYLLERNANIESMDFVSSFALYNNREDLFKIFDDMRNLIMTCGYNESNIGSIEETYRKLHMYNKYKKFYEELDLSDEDRIRYGFSISEDTRNKVLEKKHQ